MATSRKISKPCYFRYSLYFTYICISYTTACCVCYTAEETSVRLQKQFQWVILFGQQNLLTRLFRHWLHFGKNKKRAGWCSYFAICGSNKRIWEGWSWFLLTSFILLSDNSWQRGTCICSLNYWKVTDSKVAKTKDHHTRWFWWVNFVYMNYVL